jgi:hypothetical protein
MPIVIELRIENMLSAPFRRLGGFSVHGKVVNRSTLG